MKKITYIVLSFVSLFASVSFVNGDSLSFPEIELGKYYGPITLLINTHLEIGNCVDDSRTLTFDYYTTLLDSMQQLADFDIVAYLGRSLDIESSLTYILDRYSELLSKASAVQNTLELKLEKMVQTKSDCDASKNLSDKNFSLAFKDNNSKEMERYLDLSLEYDRCSSESRIYYNVYKKILSQIKYYYEILEVKYSYFNENKYEIVENYPNILYKVKK